MKLYVFAYRAYGWHELFAVIGESEEQARVAVDADAKERESTSWFTDQVFFEMAVYEAGQVVQFLAE